MAAFCSVRSIFRLSAFGYVVQLLKGQVGGGEFSAWKLCESFFFTVVTACVLSSTGTSERLFFSCTYLCTGFPSISSLGFLDVLSALLDYRGRGDREVPVPLGSRRAPSDSAKKWG